MRFAFGQVILSGNWMSNKLKERHIGRWWLWRGRRVGRQSHRLGSSFITKLGRSWWRTSGSPSDLLDLFRISPFNMQVPPTIGFLLEGIPTHNLPVISLDLASWSLDHPLSTIKIVRQSNMLQITRHHCASLAMCLKKPETDIFFNDLKKPKILTP